MTEPYRERILELLQTRQIIHPRDLTSRGIPRSYLTRLTEEMVLRRSGRESTSLPMLISLNASRLRRSPSEYLTG